MRRRVALPEQPPEHLLIFTPPANAADLPEALRAWAQARMTWARAYGWPGGAVACIQEHYATRRHLMYGIRPDDEGAR